MPTKNTTAEGNANAFLSNDRSSASSSSPPTTRAERHWHMARTAAEFIPAYVLIATVSYCSIVYNDAIIDTIAGTLPFIFGDLRERMSCGKSVRAIDVTWTFAGPLIVYWTTALFYFFLDWYVYVNEQLPIWKHRYAKKTPHIVHHLYRRAIRMMLGIALVVNPLALVYIVVPLFRLRQDVMCDVDNILPSPHHNLPKFVVQVGVIYAFTDVIFYTMHRLCHEVPFLYQYVHKAHHAFVDSYGVCASACHPVEQVIVNLATVVVPSAIAGVPYHWATIWLALAVFNTVCSHSGYAWNRPLVSSRTHDTHHKYQLCDYGTNFLMDVIFRTRYEDVIGKAGRS